MCANDWLTVNQGQAKFRIEELESLSKHELEFGKIPTEVEFELKEEEFIEL